MAVELGPTWPAYAADQGLLLRVQDFGPGVTEVRVINQGWAFASEVDVDLQIVAPAADRSTVVRLEGLEVPPANRSTVQLFQTDQPYWLGFAFRDEVSVELFALRPTPPTPVDPPR
ncbi:MAG: hypothetical protein GY898_23460 [Proteobacteria bacterium]|nr:hypothetical protein [Pseudomonadota bacterium]